MLKNKLFFTKYTKDDTLDNAKRKEVFFAMGKKLKGLLLALVLCLQVVVPAAKADAATVLYNNATGKEGNFDYELWKDYGSTSMTLKGNGLFECWWQNIGNALFRKGIKWDSTKTYSQLGNITVNYGVDYQPNGNSYLCVYGWCRNPLVEYYIVESWGTWRPPGANSKGTITVDGGTYDVYETTRVNQPSIDGNTTFKQYWSVRTSKRTSGTISVTEHFKAWERMGMQMGKMYEAALTVEGYQSSGWADVYKFDISVGGNVSTGGNNNNNNQNQNNNNNNNGGNVNVGNENLIQCESMTRSGQYAGTTNSPFNGVALYANNDAVAFNKYFAYDTHDFTLRGASNGNKTAKVDLVINNEKKGTFSFTGTSATDATLRGIKHPTGDINIKLVVSTDDGTWDVYLDQLTIGSATNSGSGNTNNNNNQNTNNNNNNQNNNNNNNNTSASSGDIYYIKNVNSGKYLDVANGSADNNANVQQWSFNGQNAQKFKLVSAGNGYHYLYTGASGYTKVVDVSGKKTANGTNIIQYAYSGAANQQFKVQQQSDGTYAILTGITGGKSGLDVYNWSTSDGGNVNQWEYWGGECQKWILEKVDGGSNNNTGNNTNNNTGNTINPNGKMIALTFDDGPTSTTTQVLDILDKYNVKATFFLIGNQINDSTKSILQRQSNSGHELANHSYTHSDMKNMSWSAIQNEINQTNNLIKQYTGQTPKFFRPPYISVSNTMYSAIDMAFIQGSMHNDWENSVSASQRANSVLQSAKDGDIILLHDFYGNNNTVQALPTIIEGLKNQGYQFVTLSQLFQYKGKNANVDYKIWSNVYN